MSWWTFANEADAIAAQAAAFALMPPDRDASGNAISPPITTCWDTVTPTQTGGWAITAYPGMALPSGAVETDTSPFPTPLQQVEP